jgi:P4 family phage/plasmid primase-like protien
MSAPTLPPQTESVLDVSNFLLIETYDPVGAADRVLMQCQNDVIHSGTQFYEWQGNYWQPVPEIAIDTLAVHLLKKPSRSYVADFKYLIAVHLHRPINTNPLAVHLENYALNLETFQVQPSDAYKEACIIGHLPIKYVPGATAPKWLNFLQQVMQNDAQKMRLVQEFFGYCLLGDNRYQKALVLLGAGNNGKSVLLEVLQSLFDRVTFLDLKQIEDERYVHHLQDAWLNVASELAYKSVETTANIKAVIAGETIQAAPKYHKGFSFRPRAKIAFATNGLPRNNDTSQGYFRRLLIVNMDYRIANPNTNIVRELRAEIPGIFNWLLQGLTSLMRRGTFEYENPYLELYKEESSSLYAWFIEEGQQWLLDPQDFRDARGQHIHTADIVSGENEVFFSAFFKHYEAYCSRGGMRASGRNKLRSECERLQMPVRFKVGNYNQKIIAFDVTDFGDVKKSVTPKDIKPAQDEEAPF